LTQQFTTVHLSKLQAEFQSAVDSTGTRHLTLQFLCPNCDNGHWHQIPLHQGKMARIGDWLVWEYRGGQTVNDISLAPSYLCDCLHAFIVRGSLHILPDKQATQSTVSILTTHPVADEEQDTMAARLAAESTTTQPPAEG
jgi:hypothetical protein